MSNTPSFALTIAGSDGTGGAGIGADLRTFESIGVQGTSVMTCLVAQNESRVARIEPLSPEVLASQFSTVAEACPVRALKTGMTWSAEIVETIVSALWKIRQEKAWPELRVVVDPVGIASTGDDLSDETWASTFQGLLLPMADLVTPNRAEAELLLGGPIEDRHFLEAGQALSDHLGCAVLLKGGHFASEEAEITDLLVEPNEEPVLFTDPRIEGATDFHGTGCVLSAAITAHLALGQTIPEAVKEGRIHLRKAMKNAFRWEHQGREWSLLDSAHRAPSS